MARRASGKYAYLIDDRSGRKIRYKDARTEWSGLRVHKKDWEPKQSLLDPPNLGPEATSLANPRPDNDIDRTTVKLGTLFGRGTPPTQAAFGNVILGAQEDTSGLALATGIGQLELATGVTLAGIAIASAKGTLTIATEENADGLELTSEHGALSFGAQENLAGINLTSAKGDVTKSASSNFTATGIPLASAHGTNGLVIDLTEIPPGILLESGRGDVSFQASSNLVMTGIPTASAKGDIVINTQNDVTGLQLTSARGTISISIDNTGWGAQSWGQNVWGT